MRASPSISHICVSGEADPSTIFGTEEVPPPKKNQHMVNFQTTEDKLVAVHSSPGEDVIWDTEETQIPNSEVWQALLNEYPKKRLVHEERDNY